MADKLIFPIGFDLESGLQTAKNDVGRVARQLEDVIKKTAIKVPVGLDAATAKQLREEAKDIDRVLANIKNNYGSGQLKGLSIGFINTQKEIDGIKRLEIQLQTLREQRTSLVNGGATIEELRRIDAEIQRTEIRLKMLYQAFNKDQSSNVAISQQIVKLKQLAEELAGIDRMYARMQASAAAANKPVNSYEVNEMLARRREIMEEITRVTKTATEAQKELFNIKGVGVGASQGIFGVGGEQALSAITQQISRYEELKNKLREVEGEYERLKAMQAQGMGDQSAAINQTLQRRIAIQKELGDITQTAAQAQKELEKKAQATAAAFQRGRGAIENFNRVMKLPENRIMNIQQKINMLNQALKRVSIGSDAFNKIVGELTRLSKLLDEAKAKQEALTGAQKKSGEAGKKAFREQTSYLNILIKRLAVYTSLDAVMGFLTKVREVTAQFELQRVSLGAIIQDQTRANQLFNEIKQFALKSPVKILDLTKYTKQLAAFRFETDTLFDTTKRVADISVGLSVPMDRLILALGHVKASTYLTGITLRQFSMAGIPMLELLAERFSELEGRAVSTTDVLKRVHDKMVSFEDVNQIFINLTSSGGMFYNMQEKQGNTLYGMWAKLGDAASVMYDEIGNTDSVNSAMKSTIQLLTDMMRNWRDVARITTEVGIAFGVYKLAVLASAKATALSTVWNAKDVALRRAHIHTVRQQSVLVRNFNLALLKSGVAGNTAATGTWVFSRALHGLKGAIASTGIGALIIALGFLIDKLLFSKSAAEKLKEALEDIETESVQEQDKSIRNFERLANVVVSATSSYKEQQSALEELKRTYQKIIPVEQLTIENLKQMHGNYNLLTSSIRRYIAEQMKKKQIDEITNTYSRDILTIQRKINNELKNKYSYEQLAEFWERFAVIVKDSTKSAGKSISELVNLTVSEMGASLDFAHDIGSRWTLFANDHVDISRATTLIREQEKQIQALTSTYEADSMAMAEYGKSYQKAVEKIEDGNIKLNGVALNKMDNPLLYSQQFGNLEIKDAMVPTIKEAFAAAGIAFDEGWVSLIDNVDKNLPHLTSTIDFSKMEEQVTEESAKLMSSLQSQLDILVAQRAAYLKQIQTEEGKGKSKNEEQINSAKKAYEDLGHTIEQLEEKARKINILPNLLSTLKAKYNDLVPSDSVVKMMRQKFDSIVDYTKNYAKNMRTFRMNADEDLKAYRKRLADEVELIKNNIKAWTAAMVLARLFRNKTEEQNLQNLIDEAKLQLADLEKMLAVIPSFDKSKGSKGGSKSDPRLQTLQEIANKMAEVNKEYDELLKKEGQTRALADTQKLFAESFKQMQSVAKKYKFKLPAFEVPKTVEDVQKWYNAIIDNIKRLKLKNADKVLIELGFKRDKLAIDKQQKDIEAELKRLSEKISQTKTAREFYDKILSQTGDIELAAQMSMSIYGDDGFELQQQMAQQIQQMFSGFDIEVPVSVIGADNNINYLELEKFVRSMEKELGGVESKTYQELLKIAQQGQKDLAKTYEGYFKDLEKAKTYADKRVELARTTAEKIRKINADIEAGNIPEAIGKKTIRGLIDKEANEAAKLEYEAFKETPLYVQMFEDLEHASTTTLKTMRERLLALSKTWGSALDPTQLKEMQSRMNEITEQLRNRNPFKALKEAYVDYKNSVKDLTVNGAVERTGEAGKQYYEAIQNYGLESKQAQAAKKELRVRKEILAITRSLTDENGKQLKGQKALDKAQIKANDNLKIARGLLEEAVAEEQDAIDKATKEGRDPAKDPSVIAANKRVEAAKEEVEVSQDVANVVQNTAQTSMALKEALEKAAQMVGQMLGWAGDIARGVADISEALGADEEDVQYWNTVADSLSDIAGGITDIVNAATSGDVIGMVSSVLTAIPKMFVGFVNLFSANRIRKANKEIKRQQEILEQLEYTYSRLEKAAEKVFGRDYINNYNQQLKNLQAQATAYQKQLEAEQSKGKKADKDKIKEYEEAYRDTMDEIADMQGTLSEKFLGSDQASAARDFAKAWIDAYKEVGRAGAETSNAMKEKFQDMIENMVVEGALAAVMQKALQPMFDMIDNMNEEDFYNELFWKKVASVAAQGAEDADKGAQTLMKFLEQAGISIKDINTEYTGIKRDIAGASEGTMSNVATIGNTLMYYVSPIPGIAANVAVMRQIMETGNASATTATTAAGWTDWQQQAMDHYAAIQRNTADTVVECRRAAIAAENAVSQLQRVISTKGSTHGFNVWMKS